MIPFCIILGAMKSATTSLFEYLSCHPQVARCNEKEPSFFASHYTNDLKAYLSLWAGQNYQDKLLLEASTNYTKYPSFKDSCANMYEFYEAQDVSMKFIYIMRHPLQRIESQHTYCYARWTDKTLDDFLAENDHLVNVSRYAMQLDRYYDKFAPDQFLLLTFDEFKKDPQLTLKRVCEFLGIDPTFSFEHVDTVHNKSRGTVITRPVDRIYQQYPFVKSFANLFPKSFRAAIAKLLFRKRLVENFKLSPKQEQTIRDALSEDMARLNKTYHIDTSQWGF